MFRHVALYGITTIRFPPETISVAIGNFCLDDVTALRLSRISDPTRELLRYTRSVAASRTRTLYCQHFVER
jgi:hypothetical protein